MKVKITLFFIALATFSGCKKNTETPADSKLLHAVRGENPGIYDVNDRYVILRGANYNALGDYWQGDPNVPPTKAYDPLDIQLMAEHGLNCVRLLFSWSALEPQRGEYDQAYIQQFKQVIEEAAKYDIYVILDMHQDAWGKYIATPPDSVCEYPNKGWDGAPEWATITDGETTCSIDGTRENVPAVIHAFQNFWDNTDGIADACIAAWQQMVQATKQYDNVLGYDLLNEPGMGYKMPETAELTKVAQYYANLTSAIRQTEEADKQHIVFLENVITHNGEPTLYMVPDPAFLTDPNTVAAPHNYFESIGPATLSIEGGYDLTHTIVENNYQSIAFMGEWGFWGGQNEKVKRFAAKEDEYFGSSTFWQWSQSVGDPHSLEWGGTAGPGPGMMLIELDGSASFTGNVNTPDLHVLGRTRPNAIHGTPTSLVCNPDDGTMTLEAEATTTGTTEVWIPNWFGTPTISGQNVDVKELETVIGGYLAQVEVSGEYMINVSF
ncbi:MAG: cellulase family glycosylhydrolase [Flavobacteriales bacterium]|nr:cellulase family glycosylhydrolase [Flavobacteriales bacterium]